ncbi:putative gustatory receptor 98a [Musca domestica]|uniref:Gustatory receptor 98a n=1 Tax=Musca domestica TaxID=7370 RepID=A0A9J7IFA1_MUSDO|nr:putative gustatory receptor 98a [Musca domestica]
MILQKFQLNLKFKLNISRLHLYTVVLYSMLALNITITFFVIYLRYIKSLNAIRLLLAQYSEFILKLKLTEYALFLVIIIVIQLHLNVFTKHYVRHTIPRLKCMPEGREQDEILHVIGILQDIHYLLISNVNNLEHYFAWSLPMLILKMFSEIVLTSYWIYFSVDFKINLYFQLYGYSVIVLHIIIVFVISCLCSKCEKLDAVFSNIFHMTKHERYNPFLNALLKEMSLQIFHQKIRFTAGGFIDVNYKLFGKFLFATVCYVVILIQFHMSV